LAQDKLQEPRKTYLVVYLTAQPIFYSTNEIDLIKGRSALAMMPNPSPLVKADTDRGEGWSRGQIVPPPPFYLSLKGNRERGSVAKKTQRREKLFPLPLQDPVYASNVYES
jgi:hypothetical protein